MTDGQVEIRDDGFAIESFTDARKRNQRLLRACLRHFSTQSDENQVTA